MKSFGDLIKIEREKKSISQAHLALMCGFTSTTYVSRVELNRNSPTITVAEKFCAALNLDSDFVYKEMSGNNNKEYKNLINFSHSNERNYLNPKEILRIEDIENYKIILEKDIFKASELISSWVAITVKKYIDLNNNENQIVINKYPIYPPEVFLNPLYANPIIPIEIMYPKIFPEVIIDILNNNGVVIPKDTATLITGLRCQMGIPIHKLAKESNLAPITLSKIEGADFQRVALQDCIQLDSSLDADGSVFRTLWEAVGFIRKNEYNEGEFSFSSENKEKQKAQLINSLILLTRWWYAMPMRDEFWLDKLRDEIKERLQII